MIKKHLYIIPLFLFEVMIQLGFFWLAPMCECRWVVYSFLTVMTVAHLVVTFVLTTNNGIRKSAATVVAGSFIQAVIIGAVVLLLAVGASVRSALFLMLMLMALYTAVVSILWISIEGFGNNTNQGSQLEQNDFGDDSECIEQREDMSRRVSMTSMRERNTDMNHVNGLSGRGHGGITPPPIPVKH